MPLDGEDIKEDFYVIRIPRREGAPDLPPSKIKECCGICSYKPLAHLSDNDELKNDKNGFIQFFDTSYAAVTMKLLQWDNATKDFTLETVLTDNTYGIYHDYGFFTNGFNKNASWYEIWWQKVLQIKGEGSFKIRWDATNFMGALTIISDEYCLHAYTPRLANGTVRAEYYINGIIGVNEDDTLRRDFGTINFYNQLRLRGWFQSVKSTYTNEYTLYNSGNRVYTKNEQEPEYGLTLKPCCFNFHELMRTDVLQADRILMTDYNTENFKNWVQKDVQGTSEYAPTWHILQNKRASVTLTFRQAFNNYKKRRQ